MGKHLSQKERDKVIELLRAGELSTSAIAKRMGINQSTISKINKISGARPKQPSKPAGFTTGINKTKSKFQVRYVRGGFLE